ncbi:MAG: NAD(P)-dependent oxidoreductase [Candidatus Latescibacteria bacterium]|jgi:nucleoside-diphosphate-sugar epimerase|nr:NAD(P)-dependent oxidoreductase [Candidatus Latescibacterota bacterium]
MVQTTAVITGAPGWLGTRLVRLIAEGMSDVPAFADGAPERQVRCLVLPQQDAAPLTKIDGKFDAVTGDVTEPKSLPALFEGASGGTLFHCAGVIHPTKGLSQFYDVNVQGTSNVLAAAKDAGVKRVVHVSSNSPVGVNRSPDSVFDETSPYNPYMHYGKSKRMGEELVRQAHNQGDLETAIVRPPWFYGPDQPPRQTLFFHMIRDGKGPIVGDGNNRRSMAYVDNICQGLLLCEQVDAANGQTYWIADRQPYTMNEVLDTVERLMEEEFSVQVAHKRLKLPGFASGFALLADKMLQGVGLYHQKIHVLSEMNKTIACSISKAEKELGYDPKIALEEGMRRSLKWMVDSGLPL